MLQSLQRLPAHRRNLALRHDIDRNNVRQAASFHELHNHPQLSSTEIAIDKVYNIGMRAILHDEDFVYNEILLRLLLQVHLLDRHQAIRAPFVACIYATRCTLTDFGEAAEYFPWISRGTDAFE